MRTRFATGTAALALALLGLALPACGTASAPGGPAREATGSAGKGGSVGLKRIGDFDEPVYVTGAPGFPELLFVVEQQGRVIVLRNGHRLGKPFLDITGPVLAEGERGLLSIAFPPDYRS